MRPAPGEVALLVPGLCAPFDSGAARATRGTSHDALAPLFEGLTLPALERLLTFAKRIPGAAGRHLEEMFVHCLALGQDDLVNAPPLAAWSRLYEHDDAASSSWLRADPVHLRADMSVLRVFEARELGLTLDESFALAEHINTAHAGALPFTVEASAATRWFVRLARPPSIRSVSPSVAHGEDAAIHMPRGDDARVWHQHMNMTQMMLHDAPANTLREQQGRPLVNSLWFWGAGALPSAPGRFEHLQVAAERSWALGAARWLGGTSVTLDTLGWTSAREQAHIVCLETFVRTRSERDPLRFRQQLEEFESRWLAPLIDAVQAGQVNTLQMHIGDGVALSLNRAALRRWWSPSRWRRSSLATMLTHLAAANEIA